MGDYTQVVASCWGQAAAGSLLMAIAGSASPGRRLLGLLQGRCLGLDFAGSTG